MESCIYRAPSGICILHSDNDYQEYCQGPCIDRAEVTQKPGEQTDGADAGAL